MKIYYRNHKHIEKEEACTFPFIRRDIAQLQKRKLDLAGLRRIKYLHSKLEIQKIFEEKKNYIKIIWKESEVNLDKC